MTSLNFDRCLDAVNHASPGSADTLRGLLNQHFHATPHGRIPEWDEALARLPAITSGDIEFGTNAVTIGHEQELNVNPGIFAESLKAFEPWRKGPFQLFDTFIDTEWRSDLKWARLQPHLTPLAGRRILDIGCGNGYYLLRMLGEGAELALGVDPTLLFLYQFEAVTRFCAQPPNAYILPLRGEQLPAFGTFDTVFSLGVLYHRRAPFEHLAELHSFLRPGGELVLETLIVEGDETTVLMPRERYAMMNNVWFLPSPDALSIWLARAGFTNIRTVDVTRTTADEQRATDWMTFQSLPDFLDPNDPSRTAEGLPAPTRAILVAEKPAA